MARFVNFSIVVVLAACGGGGGGGDPDAFVPSTDAAPREVISESVPIGRMETLEAHLVGGAPGDYARVRLTGPSFDWNLHGHIDTETVIISEGLGVDAVDYQFVPPQSADWYLLLRNRGFGEITVELEIELYGALAWSGWL
jgi:hypothetical protein